jgi:hypothetical protein
VLLALNLTWSNNNDGSITLTNTMYFGAPHGKTGSQHDTVTLVFKNGLKGHFTNSNGTVQGFFEIDPFSNTLKLLGSGGPNGVDNVQHLQIVGSISPQLFSEIVNIVATTGPALTAIITMHPVSSQIFAAATPTTPKQKEQQITRIARGLF